MSKTHNAEIKCLCIIPCMVNAINEILKLENLILNMLTNYFPWEYFGILVVEYVQNCVSKIETNMTYNTISEVP